jgi:hypothetical protein
MQQQQQHQQQQEQWMDGTAAGTATAWIATARIGSKHAQTMRDIRHSWDPIIPDG